MTPAARLRAMAEKATPGEWRHRDHHSVHDIVIEGNGCIANLGRWIEGVRQESQDYHNASLIVHLRNRAQLYADLIEAAAAYRDSVSVNIDKTGRLDAQASYAALRRVEAALAAINVADKDLP